MRTCKNVFVSRSGSCLKYKEKRADARAVNVRTTAYGAQVLGKGCTAQGCRYWAAAATGARAAAPIGSATYVQNWIVHLKKLGGQSEYVIIDCANWLQELTSPNQVSPNKRAKSSTHA